MEIAIIVIVSVVAIGAVLYPLLKADRIVDAGDAADTSGSAEGSDTAIEEEINRYREAVRAQTVCARCQQANPAGSKFCYECGRPVGSDARRPGEGDMD